MRIAFFGLPLAALLLAKDGHSIVYAGICRKGATGTRRLSKLLNIAIIPDATSAEVQGEVKASRPDLIVSWFWTKKLPVEIRDAAPMGAIGAHPSLLPRRRGPDPYFWTILEGDRQTGVTVHVLDEGYDTGAIVASRVLAIDEDWGAWTLAKKLDRPSLALLRDVVRAFAEGRAPSPVPQDERDATLAPAPTDEELAIDWRRSADEIVRLVKAASPWPGATFTLGEEPMVLERAAILREAPNALLPGEAWVHNGAVGVRAGKDAVLLLAGRDEDDRSVDAAGWLERVVRIQG